jgi:hypothetical protein
MDLSKIVQIRLLKNDYVKFPSKEYFNMIYVDRSNYHTFTSELQTVIDLIHSELIEWKDAPTYEVVVERFKSNSHCLLFYYNGNCIGWNWGNRHICFDWINKVQDLPEGELYGGGCFVSRNVDRPANAGLYNYNMIFDYWINQMGYHTIYGYVDWWNKPAFRVNFQNGLTVYNYLNDVRSK